MDEMGFLGFATSGGTFIIDVVCRDGSLVPTTPDATPTYTVVDTDDSALDTGSLDAADVASKTGFRRATLSIDGSYEVGTMYTVLIEFEIAASAHTVKGTFLVI